MTWRFQGDQKLTEGNQNQEMTHDRLHDLVKDHGRRMMNDILNQMTWKYQEDLDRDQEMINQNLVIDRDQEMMNNRHEEEQGRETIGLGGDKTPLDQEIGGKEEIDLSHVIDLLEHEKKGQGQGMTVNQVSQIQVMRS